MAMDPWISFEYWRRDQLKGHDSKRGVRSAIKYARGHSRDLHIFVGSTNESGATTYTEIPAELWDETFSEEAA
jgi:hypothetical protein